MIFSLKNVVAVKALSRLFHRDWAEMSRRSLSGQEFSALQGAGSNISANDPWPVIMSVVSSGLEGLERASRWFRVMSYSGVDIPDETLRRVLELTIELNAPLSLVVLCLESVVVSSWFKLIGGEGLVDQLGYLCEIWLDRIIDDMKNGANEHNMCVVAILNFPKSPFYAFLEPIFCDMS